MKTLLAAVLLACCACIAPGLMVASASFDGQGGLWTDGVVLVALGEYEGDFSLFSPTSGVEVIFPIDVRDGGVYVYNRHTGEEMELQEGESLPAWAATVFRPGEAQVLGLEFSPAE